MLSFDPEWLAITRAFNPYMPLGLKQGAYPDEADARAAVAEALTWVAENVLAETSDRSAAPNDSASAAGDAANDIAGTPAPAAAAAATQETAPPEAVLRRTTTKRIDEVQQFVVSAPPPGQDGSRGRTQPPYYPNPQTAAFCSLLGIENRVDVAQGR